MKKINKIRTKRIFLDIPRAAELVGISLRHFRRMVEDDEIPSFSIRGKFFLLGRELEKWSTEKSKKGRKNE